MSDDLRIGLYICHCGHNIAGVISPEVLAEQARGLPGVAVCRDHLYSCSEAGQRDISKDIKEFGLNRMVVAACSPKLHEPTFRRLLAETASTLISWKSSTSGSTAPGCTPRNRKRRW